jgi:thiamine pyrophosphokinase
LPKKGLIFLNGKIPSLKVVQKFITNNNFIIAADGGGNWLRKYNILPNVIIGDFDSIHLKVLKYYSQKKVKIIQIIDQEITDFEKSLKFALKSGINKCIIFGGISSRPDHTINNFSVLKRYYKKLNLAFIDEKYEITFLRKNVEFNYKINNLISILGFPIAEGITTTGLQYPLKNETLEFGVREGTLNKSIAKKISIKFNKGDLILFKRHFI